MKVKNIWNLIWFHIVTSYVIQLEFVEFISIIDRTAALTKRKIWIRSFLESAIGTHWDPLGSAKGSLTEIT